MDFEVQTVLDNHITVEVSAPRGKVNNVNKDRSVKWPTWVWGSMGLCGKKKEGTKFFFNSTYLLIYYFLFRGFFVRGGFSSCGAQVSRCCGFSHCRAQALGRTVLAAQGIGSSNCRAQAQQLWHKGLVAPQPAECSRARDWICVTCTGRQIALYCTTREVLRFIFNWRIIALQCCVGFCHTPAWISHRCKTA